MRSLAGIARESSGGAGLGDAPSNAPYVTTAADATLTNEQVLGTTIIIRDLAANIPAASIAGRLFIESDGSQIIYRDTGLAWVEIARGVVVSDVAYNATTWDGVTTVAPSKNAVRDKIEALFPGAGIRLTNTQSIGNAAFTSVSFNTKDWDDALFWAAGTPTRLTFGVAMRVRCHSTVWFASNGTGRRIIQILLNGVTVLARKETPALNTAGLTCLDITYEGAFAAADYIEVQVFQSNTAPGGNLSTDNTVGTQPVLTVKQTA